MLSRDAKIFKDGSAVSERMVKYGQLCEELVIVVITKKTWIPVFARLDSLARLAGMTEKQLSKNVWVYPFCEVFKAIKNIKKGDWAVTAQDPFEIGLIGWLIKLIYDLPLEIQIHTDFLSPYFWQESCGNKMRVILAKFLIKRAGQIRVVSARIKKSLISLNIDECKITVLPIAVDIKKISEAPIKTNLRKKYSQFDFIILMASRFTKEKNIVLAIDVFKEIVFKYPKTLLLIVGEGAEKKNYESRIMDYGLERNTVIESWTLDLISYYKTADLFLLTSNYEGYGMAVVEAKAAGLPIIMTDVGVAGYELKTDEDVAIAPVGDKKAIYEAIIKIIQLRRLQ